MESVGPKSYPSFIPTNARTTQEFIEPEESQEFNSDEWIMPSSEAMSNV
jgi:hypothetical protein